MPKDKIPKYILNAQDYWASKTHIFGQRYIFFRGLKETNPSLYGNALSYFNQLDISKQQLDDKNAIEKLKQFQAYQYLLEDLANKELNNEKKYIAKLLEEAKNALSLEDYTKFSAALNKNGRNIDYLQLIDIINNLRQKEVYEKIVPQQINNLRLLQTNFESQTVEKQQEMEQAYIKNHDEYTNTYSTTLSAAIKDAEDNIITKFEKSYNQQVTNLILQCLHNMQQEFIDGITTELDKRGYPADNTSIEAIIQNIIVDYVLDNIGKNTNINTALTLANAEKYLDQAIQQTNNRAFTHDEKALKTLESQAIKGGKKLADTFKELPDVLKAEILNKYDGADSGDLHKAWAKLVYASQYNLAGVPKAKEFFSKRFKQVFDIKKQEIEKTNAEILAQIPDDKDKIAYILTQLETPLKEGLLKKLKISVLKSYDANEILALASKEQQSELLLGKVIQLKNDVMFSVYFPSKIIPNTIFTEYFDTYFNNMQKRFMEQYAKEGKRTTDVAAAAKAYYDQYKQLFDVYHNILHTYGEDSKEAKYAADKLKNTFFASVSAKNYEFYNNNLGFRAGNLGASGRATEVIENILKMYELGGISTIDANLLIGIVLNSSEGTILGANKKDLLENVKNYLIGGAALMMFDDGFSNTKNVYEKIKELLNDNAPTQIHLYYLNNLFVPASYVLRNIYENLMQLTNEITQEFEDIGNKRYTSMNVKSKLIITNNVSEEAYAPEYENEPSTPKRWSIVSNKAQEEVKIEFLFMAGLLDIFEHLPNAFNNIKV